MIDSFIFSPTHVGAPHLQVEDIVRAAKRACYRAVPMAATA